MREQELATRVSALPEGLIGRVAADDLAQVQTYVYAGEWGEAVDLLVACLVVEQIPVTTAERDELAALVEAMKLETTEPLDRLNVQS
jgi:hypothetical protein